MKKIFTLMLVLLMALFLVACETSDTTNDGEDTAKQTETQKDESETEDESSDDTAFDTSWAQNDFEALMPELPFTGWSTSQVDENTYKMELTGLNTSPATNAPDSGEPDGADKTKLLSYLNSLSNYGFVVEETGADYMWVAKDASGNEIEFMCADGGCWITIKKANS